MGKKRIFLTIVLILFFHSTTILADLITKKRKQVGIVFEERPTFINGYIFYNHQINNHWYYDFRGYYIHNFITTVQTAMLPPVSAQENLDGSGAVGILGYKFSVNHNMSLMPFIREQYFINAIAAYKDILGNEIDSDSFTSFFGLMLLMKVNSVFSINIFYFGGYQINNLYGKGVYHTTNKAKIYAWPSVMEIDLSYKITPTWIFTPYFQWVVIANNPNAVALAAPMNQSGTTVSHNVYALRLAYAFK